MSEKILVTYGSKYGATAEISERIAKTLQESGLQVDVLSARDVKNIAAYRAVVLGSAIYIGQWRKEAVNFVKKNQTGLKNIPLWIFSSGPTGEGDPKELVQGWLLPKNIQAVVEALRPRDVVIFQGAVNVNKISGIERWMIGKVNAPAGDFRNWDAITAWAKSIAQSLS